LKKTEPYLVRGAGPSPDALDLVALVDGFEDVKPLRRTSSLTEMLCAPLRWLDDVIAGASDSDSDDELDGI